MDVIGQMEGPTMEKRINTVMLYLIDKTDTCTKNEDLIKFILSYDKNELKNIVSSIVPTISVGSMADWTCFSGRLCIKTVIEILEQKFNECSK